MKPLSALSALLLGALALPAAATGPVGPAAALQAEEANAAAVHDAIAPSVVKIDVSWLEPPAKLAPGLEQFLRQDSQGNATPRHGTGTGVLWDASGHVVTSSTVVEAPGGTLKVTLADGSRRDATLVAVDDRSKVAVLKIEGATTGLRPATPGPSGSLRVGQRIYVMGASFGKALVFVDGMLGAVTSAYADDGYQDLAVNTSLNPGTAGGPLFDSAGRMVGMVKGVYAGNSGGGFALGTASDEIAWVVPRLLADGHIDRAQIGISIQDPDAPPLPPNLPAGVAVFAVDAAGPGQRAGLRPRDGDAVDIITAMDGAPIASFPELRRALERYRPGDACTLTVWRAGRTRSVSVILDRANGPAGAARR
jgi:S1-C subfamily serine protease